MARKPPANLRKYFKTLVGGAGVLAIGGVVYKRDSIKKYLYSVSQRRLRQLQNDTKNSDFIYIKYHLYKDSLRLFKLDQSPDSSDDEGIEAGTEKNWIDVMTNPVGKWWKTFKHSVAWRLLNIAQHGNQSERLKAVRQLAMIDHLKDWDFRHLAQICDARTAVSLARSGCDTRWFLPVFMHGQFMNPRGLLLELKTKLTELTKSNTCVSYFMKKYFTLNIDGLDPYTEAHYQIGTPIMTDDADLMKEIISFLHHITKDEGASKEFILKGGLKMLMELKKIFEEDKETLTTLCKTLANMSLAEDCLNDFFDSGWVGVLADWQTDHDMRLQVIASKVLANLDKDDPNNAEYPPNVYPLHPRLRTRNKPKGDVVFVHGLLGSVFITWRQKDKNYTSELGLYGKNAFYTSETDDVFLVGESKRLKVKNTRKMSSRVPQADKLKEELDQISDVATKELIAELKTSPELGADWEVVHPDVPLNGNEHCAGEFSVPGNKWDNMDRAEEYTNCWPMDWLPADFPNYRIIGIDYTSAVSEWSANFTKYCPCEKDHGQIDVRSTHLLERISRSKVGENRPVVWIGHSMGGILTKLILLKSLDNPDSQVQQIAKNTKGIVFLGVPHRGSPIAKWKQHMQVILSPSIEVKEMEEGAPRLLLWHTQFMQMLKSRLQNVNVVSIAEGSPTMLTTFKFPLRIVTEESANINYGDFYILKDDHLSLSKPVFKQSFLYQRLTEVVEKASQTSTPDEKDSNANSGNIFTALLRDLHKLLTIFERYSSTNITVNCKAK